MVKYLNDSGLVHVITATVGTYKSSSEPCYPHAPGSYHCRPGTDGNGLAVDVAVSFGGAHDSPGLLAIRQAIQKVDAQSAEVIYAGPGHPPCIKNGHPFAYDAHTMNGHHDHVHWAVEKGVFPVWPTPQQPGGWTEHPIQETDVAYRPVDVAISTDDQGNGWLKVPYIADQIIGHLGPGIRPGADHRYETAEVGFAPEDAGTIVSVSGWTPHTTCTVRIRVAA